MARFNIAMLSEEAQTGEAQVQSELDVVGQQAEDAIAEAVQVQTDIENAQQATDDAAEVVEEMEEERQALQVAQEQGGIDRVAMESLQRAVKRFEKRTGVPCVIKSMGMESFDSKTTRAQATKIAMEGVGEYIKKLMKMLMDGLAKIYNMVKDFFTKMIVGAERLGKRAKQVQELAKNAMGKTAPADAKITTGGVLEFARSGGKVVQGSSFASQYAKDTAPTADHNVAIKDTIDFYKSGNAYIEALEATVKPDNKKNVLNSLLKNKPSTGKASYTDGLGMSGMPGTLLGEYKVRFVQLDPKATWEQLSKHYGKVKMDIARADDVKEASGDGISPLAVKDALAVAKHAETIMAGYVNTSSDIDAIRKEIDAITKEAKVLSSQKDTLPEESEQVRVAVMYIRAEMNAFLRYVVSSRTYNIRLTKAALDYATASIKAIKAETEEK